MKKKQITFDGFEYLKENGLDILGGHTVELSNVDHMCHLYVAIHIHDSDCPTAAKVRKEFDPVEVLREVGEVLESQFANFDGAKKRPAAKRRR